MLPPKERSPDDGELVGSPERGEACDDVPMPRFAVQVGEVVHAPGPQVVAGRVRRISRRGSRVAIALGVLLPLAPVPRAVYAAVTITTQRGTRPASTLRADGDRLRIDHPAPEPGGRATVILLDAAAKRMVTLDESTKSYTEITEEDMKRLSGQMEGFRAQMQERMKSMPPEQRQKMEELMTRGGGGLGAGAVSKKQSDWVFEALGQKKTVNGFRCEMYRVKVDGKPREEDCISPWSAGVVKREDFAGLARFGEEMVKGLGGGGATRAGEAFLRFDKAPGLPISRVPLDADGKPGEEEQIKTIKRGEIAPALFAVPLGFTKKELPFKPGGPGGPGGARRGTGDAH